MIAGKANIDRLYSSSWAELSTVQGQWNGYTGVIRKSNDYGIITMLVIRNDHFGSNCLQYRCNGMDTPRSSVGRVVVE